MARGYLHTIFPVGLLLLLPLLGIYLTNRPLSPFLSLPILLTTPGEASFAPSAFGLLAILIGITLAPFVFRVFSCPSLSARPHQGHRSIPWWGWAALLWVLCGWLLAWTRFPWMTGFQPYMFPVLWFGYIFVINAFTYSRTGRCLLRHHTTKFLTLFPLSAAFWWTFEYLNQFVHNWHYVHLPEIAPIQFFFLTSVSFSTVLPAVLSTAEWLRSFHWLTNPFEDWHPVPAFPSPPVGWMLLATGCLGILMIGIWPAFLFPALWLSPLLILTGYTLIRRERTVLDDLASGNWLSVILPALAGLICGFWWELWNAGSLVRWEYSIPFVHGFQLFEMPILGYAGYLPFGLECLVLTEWFLGIGPWSAVRKKYSQETLTTSRPEHSPKNPIASAPTQ